MALRMAGRRAAFGLFSHPADTQAVRATFFIDPDGVLRAMVHYP